MKTPPLLVAIVVSMLCSCNKTEDPDLGEFQHCEHLIDMSQQNKFEETLFCKEWIISEVYYETYVDGVLQSAEDHTESHAGFTVSFQDDHTLFYGDAKGSWLYTHNHLLMHFHTFYEVNEVIQLTSDLLTFKQEFRPSGLPYFKDPSGIHYFWVYECVSK